MRTVRISIIVVIILTVLSLIAYFAYRQTKTLKRDIPTLFNHYYQLKNTSPWQSKTALELIIAQDPNNIIATRELANWYLRHGDTRGALDFLQKSHQQFPNDDIITYELAKLYILLSNQEAAEPLLRKLSQNPISKYRKEAMKLHNFFATKKILHSERTSSYMSYIEPVYFKESPVLAPLYQQAQEMVKLNPELSRKYLNLILSVNPNEYNAYIQLGYLDLKQKKYNAALLKFSKAFNIKPQASVAIQIGYLLAKKEKTQEASSFFDYGLQHGNDIEKSLATRALDYLKRLKIMSETDKKPVLLSKKEQLLMAFYNYKKGNPGKAWPIIWKLLRLYPQDLRIWKEAGYYAVTQKRYKLALKYWLHLYTINPEPEYALQLAYLYDGLDDKPKAFHYFYLASKTHKRELKYKAELAMTNIGGAHTKILPDPYFIDVYIAPFYFSRFDLGVLPSITRAGITLNKEYYSELYLGYRRTSDSRSGTIEGLIIENSISQIFEDNVAIYSVGFRSRLWADIPLLGFIEVGRAEDLIYRDRPRWRDDVRGGLVYYNEWGAKPTYTSNLEFPFKRHTTLYADTIYYSRYDNNIIGTAWFRPGLRVATYQSSSLDIYLANFLVLDKNHEFYNNVYAIGPGIVFQPSNRLNLKFRFESHQAYYIRVNSPTPNPYRSKYYNNIFLIEGFIRF